MREFLEIISKSEIMKDINKEDIQGMLTCLNAAVFEFKKNNFVFTQGSPAGYLGIVLSGNINITKTDFYGNKNIILSLKPSDMFAESVVFAADNKLPFDVEAETDCRILAIDKNFFTKTCCKNCSFHTKLIENLIFALANKNTKLTKKINIISQRSIRQKVLELLLSESKRQNTKHINLSMSREEMSDYLSVDRSALSRELSALKNEGLIDYHMNVFQLFNN